MEINKEQQYRDAFDHRPLQAPAPVLLAMFRQVGDGKLTK